MQRALHLLRRLGGGGSRSQTASAALPGSAGDETGLDAFASETPAPATPPRTNAVHPSGIPWLPAALAAVVVLQAGPTFLWLQGRLTAQKNVQSVAPANASPADSAGAVATSGLAPPCEAPPVPVPAAAATTPSTGGGGTPKVVHAAGSAPAPAPAPPPAGAVAGRLAVSAPVAMHIYSRGKVVGTTEAETVLLPVGSHELEFVSEEAGYRTRQTVSIQAGRTSTIRLAPPSGTLHVNALPWAEVWLDNRRIGETPIGNLQTGIGVHEVLFRHPELGERKTTVLVTLKGPARVSMDLREK